MAQTDELVNKSARKEEMQARSAGGVMRFYFAQGVLSAPMLSLPIDPPAYWSPSRDRTLADAYRRCGLWASAVNIAVTRIASLGYEVKGDVGLRVREARKMLGRDWVGLMQRLTRDYVTYDNGGFMQIVRASAGYGSRVLGYLYLPGGRCVRTGDPDIPVVYMDELGYMHELKAHQVVAFSDMPEDDLFGVGLSATSRAYDAIYEHLSVRQFFKEKATGRRPLALDFLSGISQDAVDETIAGAQADAAAKGYQAYMGAALTANSNPVPLTHVRIPLAELPAGFDQVLHTELTQIEFSDAIGIDPVELNPRLIGNRSLGAGSQAEVLDDKQSSKGLVSFRQQILAFFNDTERWHALPNSVTFAFSEKDLKDQAALAGIKQTRAATRASMITSGEITPDQARQLAVDDGDLPESFLQVDTTPEETLTDEDKATDDPQVDPSGAAVVQALPAAAAAPAAARPALPGVATKEVHTGAMIAAVPSPDDAVAIGKKLVRVDWPTGSSVTAAPDLHCTLAYLGKAADIGEDERARMIDVAKQLAADALAPAKFNGIARFSGSDEDGDAIVVLLSGSGLARLGNDARARIGNASEHEFLPHMTLAYIPKDAPTPTIRPPFETLDLPTLSVVFAGDAMDIPIAPDDAPQDATERAAVALKAYATTLASVTMPTTRRQAPAGYWAGVTKGFDEIGRIWTIAARQNIPQDEGTTGRSIRYAVTNKGTAAVTLKLFAGSKSRPEVAIRAVLFGRKGFRARKGKVLAFNAGGRTVFARKVAGAASNDWLSRSLDQIGPQVAAITKSFGDPTIKPIEVEDIPGARLYKTAPPAPGSPRGKTKRKK